MVDCQQALQILPKTIPDQPPEDDNGNREYKWKLTNKSIEKLATQLAFRLTQGQGKAIYLIGVHDCGSAVGIDEISMHVALQNITHASKKIKGTKIDSMRIYNGSHGQVATIRLSNEGLKDSFFI